MKILWTHRDKVLFTEFDKCRGDSPVIGHKIILNNQNWIVEDLVEHFENKEIIVFLVKA